MSVEHTIFPADAMAGPRPAIASAGTMRIVLAYLLLGGLALSPLLWVSVPALVDYPNHLARMSILAHPGTGPSGQLNYVTHWQLLPTLAMDLVVPALAQLMPIEAAGRLFIAATMALLVLGTAALHRALWGRAGLWPLCSLLFLYNDAFYWGFLNYLFGLGLALLTFAGWLATARWPTGWRLFVFSVAASLLFLMHLFAFGVYGLLLLSYEIGRHLGDRRRTHADLAATLIGLAQFAVPALLWLATLSNGGPHYTHYGDWLDKLLALTAPMTYGEVGFVAVPVCFGLIYLGWRSGALILAPAMRLPVAAMIVAAALMPNWFFGSWAADVRLPIALSFIAVAGLRLRVPRRVGVGLGVIAILFLVVRVFALTQSWRDMDHRFAEFRTAAATMPAGSRVLIVQSAIPDAQRAIAGVPEFLVARQSPDFFHMPALAVIDRGDFIPYLFTGWTTVRPTLRNAGRYQSQGAPITPDQLAAGEAPGGNPEQLAANLLGEPAYWRDWPNKFDFVLWLDFGTDVSLPPALTPWATGSFFHVYRIKPS